MDIVYRAKKPDQRIDIAYRNHFTGYIAIKRYKVTVDTFAVTPKTVDKGALKTVRGTFCVSVKASDFINAASKDNQRALI